MLNLLVIDFVNSQWYNTHDNKFEPLRNEEWVSMLFRLWNIPYHFKLIESEIRELIGLREWLFSLTSDLSNNNSIKDKDMIVMNNYLEKSKVNIQVRINKDQYFLEKIPQNHDWNWLINRILLSFIKLLIEYDTSRIRICQNTECQIVFYDNSKSRTKKFCHSSCANVVKVRRHRAKQSENSNKLDKK